MALAKYSTVIETAEVNPSHPDITVTNYQVGEDPVVREREVPDKLGKLH